MFSIPGSLMLNLRIAKPKRIIIMHFVVSDNIKIFPPVFKYVESHFIYFHIKNV